MSFEKFNISDALNFPQISSPSSGPCAERREIVQRMEDGHWRTREQQFTQHVRVARSQLQAEIRRSKSLHKRSLRSDLKTRDVS